MLDMITVMFCRVIVGAQVTKDLWVYLDHGVKMASQEHLGKQAHRLVLDR